jgi:hypothetical protein
MPKEVTKELVGQHRGRGTKSDIVQSSEHPSDFMQSTIRSLLRMSF